MELSQKSLTGIQKFFLFQVPMNIQKDWKATLESAYSFMFKYSKITVWDMPYCKFQPKNKISTIQISTSVKTLFGSNSLRWPRGLVRGFPLKPNLLHALRFSQHTHYLIMQKIEFSSFQQKKIFLVLKTRRQRLQTLYFREGLKLSNAKSQI